tara:strand:- start:44068 stop:45621 length:1554 start_codon:yes stop_codon:yes gene_type:complete
MKEQKLLLLCMVLVWCFSCKDTARQHKNVKMTGQEPYYKEMYRPQFHFSPEEKWMNDPNGLVYHNGRYHLFYQYYPDDIVWGPMHWGHAVSDNMMNWEHRPIALYPDANGYIFSGSAVVDKDNTSGLGTLENPPMVAIFTYHSMEGEQSGRNDYQTQGIAYSLDNGDSWTKYGDNPVISNPGIKDFRDPKVFWNRLRDRWTMLLVAGDHLQIWESGNLRDWEYKSEFGKEQGAHGGVWECPDLFPLTVKGTGEEKWVLLISINPGAPNGGSGTQYFVGDFDGTTFTSPQTEFKWVDHGTDNYAGVTYNDAPIGERLFIGWMSNWEYARDTPTEKWRSAMTLPRAMELQQTPEGPQLFSYPLASFDSLLQKGTPEHLKLKAKETLTKEFDHFNRAEIRFWTDSKEFGLRFKNGLGEELVMDMSGELFTLDRGRSGKTDFKPSFGEKQQMPIPTLPDGGYEVRVIMDWSSVEIFINGGQYVMTAQLFPNAFYKNMELTNPSNAPMELSDFSISEVESTW